MIATRSICFNPYLVDDDDMSSICNTHESTNERSFLGQGKYTSQFSIPHKETDLLSPQDLDYFLGCEHPDQATSKTHMAKQSKDKDKTYSGEIYGRCNRSSIIFRKWTEYTWFFAKPSTIILFGSKDDLNMYQSSNLKDIQKKKLVKFAIDFDMSGKLTEKAQKKHKSFKPHPIPSGFKTSKSVTYAVTSIKSKVYKAMNPNMYNFKIIRWNEFERKKIAAFGSYDANALKEFHKTLSKCIKRANKASRPKSEKHYAISGDEGCLSNDDDVSLASHTTGVSLWSYYTAGSTRSSKSRTRYNLNKIINKQYRQ